MSVLRTFARTVLPRPAHRVLKATYQRYVLNHAVRQLAGAISREDDLPAGLWSDLVYGWGNDYAAYPEYLKTVLRHAQNVDGPILEYGSGLSTLLLGLVADKRGLEVWSLEHIPVWAEKIHTELKSWWITNVHLCAARLQDYGTYVWYHFPWECLPTDFSLVVCDGPPADTPGGRYGLVPVMRSRLKAGCTILLDDANRAPERAILARWAQDLETTPSVFASDAASKSNKRYATLIVPEVANTEVRQGTREESM
jgi:hypothetical protein